MNYIYWLNLFQTQTLNRQFRPMSWRWICQFSHKICNDVLLERMSCITCTNNKIDVRIGQILRHLTETWAAVFASTIDRVVSIWYLRVHFDDCVDMILILRSSVQVRGLFQDAGQKVNGRLWAEAPENATCEIALWSLRIRI